MGGNGKDKKDMDAELEKQSPEFEKSFQNNFDVNKKQVWLQENQDAQKRINGDKRRKSQKGGCSCCCCVVVLFVVLLAAFGGYIVAEKQGMLPEGCPQIFGNDPVDAPETKSRRRRRVLEYLLAEIDLY